MTLAVDHLARCRPDLLEDSARGLAMEARSIQEAARSRPRFIWSGIAADAAEVSLDALQACLDQLGDVVSACAGILLHAATGLRPACEALQRAAAHASVAGLQIDCGGRVTPVPVTFPTGPRGDGVLTPLVDAAAAAVAIEALARAALRAADELDAAAAAALRRLAGRLEHPATALPPAVVPIAATWRHLVATVAHWWPGAGRAGSDWLPARIPSGAPAADVGAWWAVLPAPAREAFLRARPDELGRLDGLPARVRHEANVAVLSRELGAAEQAIARFSTARPSMARFEELATAVHVAGVLGAVRRELAADPTRLLVTLDLSDGGLAAVAVGDPDTASNVAVLVPGLASEVAGDLDNVVSDAEALHSAAGRLAPAAILATVAWIGYRTPDVRTVAFDARARAGARRLTSFSNGMEAAREIARLDATPPDAMHLTLIGHSYGSLAIGLALRRGLDVDDAIFVGSPGVGAWSVGELDMDGAQVFVGESPTDPVADFAWFGRDPSDRGFGASELPTRAAVVDGERLRSSFGHSDYFHAGTTSLHSMAAIAVAQPAAR